MKRDPRALKTDVKNYGYTFKGQDGVQWRKEQHFFFWRGESEEDSEEQSKETEQFWDKIWTGKRGLR